MSPEVVIPWNDLEAVEVPIVGFSGQATYLFIIKMLLVWVRDKENSWTIETNFVIVDSLLVYNVILPRLTPYIVKAVIAPYMLLIQVELNVVEVKKH